MGVQLEARPEIERREVRVERRKKRKPVFRSHQQAAALSREDVGYIYEARTEYVGSNNRQLSKYGTEYVDESHGE